MYEHRDLELKHHLEKIQGEQGIGTTVKILESMTKLTDKDRKDAELVAKQTAEERAKMQKYRSKACAYNLVANQNISVMKHLVQKQNLVIGRLRGQIQT
jgi:hypothetical protein